MPDGAPPESSEDRAAQRTPDQKKKREDYPPSYRWPSEEPDVLIDVPVVKVDEIELEVADLRARLSLHAEVLDLLKLHVGADVTLGRVSLRIKGVEAQALLKVRLDNVAAMIDRVLTTVERNPQVLEHVTREVGTAIEHVGRDAGEAVGELSRGTGEAVGEAGRVAAEQVGTPVRSSVAGPEATGQARRRSSREVPPGPSQAASRKAPRARQTDQADESPPQRPRKTQSQRSERARPKQRAHPEDRRQERAEEADDRSI